MKFRVSLGLVSAGRSAGSAGHPAAVLGQVLGGSCPWGHPSSRSVWGQCHCLHQLPFPALRGCSVRSCSVCLWESGQPEGKGLRKEYGLRCSEVMNAVLESSLGEPGFLLDTLCPAPTGSARCSSCDWNTGALAMPVLNRAVGRNGSIPLLPAGCSREAQRWWGGKAAQSAFSPLSKILGAAGCLGVEMTNRAQSGPPQHGQECRENPYLTQGSTREGPACLPGVSCVFQHAHA